MNKQNKKLDVNKIMSSSRTVVDVGEIKHLLDTYQHKSITAKRLRDAGMEREAKEDYIDHLKQLIEQHGEKRFKEAVGLINGPSYQKGFDHGFEVGKRQSILEAINRYRHEIKKDMIHGVKYNKQNYNQEDITTVQVCAYLDYWYDKFLQEWGVDWENKNTQS